MCSLLVGPPRLPPAALNVNTKPGVLISTERPRRLTDADTEKERERDGEIKKKETPGRKVAERGGTDVCEDGLGEAEEKRNASGQR